ncbi:TIM44-like domain-containing protein [Ramlibacter monticola]|uniref:Tim44 domain-containing protein n=1 Tax=Ramlibacter monticola TaxID=1926872 RepID=A0A937CUK7_9BURK|nr:Tim44-like domain-containing protein [Ramlibacter monticola]MBL0392147.1 Tim44 domain-containing protein [Ramlibacter monticola]
MRKTLALFAIVLSLGMTLALDAEAKRLGGGRSAGMQRQGVTAPANNATPATTPGAPGQAAPVAGAPAAAAMPGAAAAATAKRSWLGPVAGLAAGLGIAALASHFGFGEGLANMLTIALLVMAVVFVFRFVMRKRAASQGGALAGAGATGNSGGVFRQPQAQDVAYRNVQAATQRPGGSLIGSSLAGAAATTGVGNIPAGFDVAAFERTARDQFTALQAANDAKDLDRLRDYLSPEMFDVVRSEIAERGDAPQKTEVFGLNAQVLDVAEDADRYVVSVRFTGSVREQAGAVPEDLDEVWHLTKPKAGFGGWMIAGIQQAA